MRANVRLGAVHNDTNPEPDKRKDARKCLFALGREHRELVHEQVVLVPLVLRPVQPAMQCADDGRGSLPCQGKANVVEVVVHHIKVVYFTQRLAECDRQQECEVVIRRLLAPEGLLACRHQTRRCPRIA